MVLSLPQAPHWGSGSGKGVAGLGCGFRKRLKGEKVFYAHDDRAGRERLWLTVGILARRTRQLPLACRSQRGALICEHGKILQKRGEKNLWLLCTLVGTGPRAGQSWQMGSIRAPQPRAREDGLAHGGSWGR